MSKYPDWLEDRFGDDIPEWAEVRWGDDEDDDKNWNRDKKYIIIKKKIVTNRIEKWKKLFF